MGIYAELKERRLVQILVSYLAAGFVGLNVFDQLADRGVVPELVYRIALLWYVMGIGAALIIGWYHGEKGEQKAPMREIVMLSILGMVTLGLSGSSIASYVDERAAVAAAAESELDLSRIAVAYFDDLSADGELRAVADGLTEGLIDELSGVRSLDVVSRNGVAPYRGSELSPDSIARLLEAGTVVDGTVEPAGDRIQIGLRLYDAQSGAVIERAGFERPAGDLFAISAQITEEASTMLRRWLGEEVRLRRTERETDEVRAWAMYQRAEKKRKDALEAEHAGDRDAARRLLEEADGLAGQAATLDSTWAKPPVLRSAIDYRLSRLARSRDELVEHIEDGLRHADAALAGSPNHAAALAQRGTIRYWRYLQRLEVDPAAQDALLARARQDLERAVDLDPALADAHQVLSHLYYRDNRAQAILAARTAYQEDAYLDFADEVLARLFNGNYDLEQFTQARRWCEEGQRRFPGDYRFTECELLLMTTPELEPEPDRARALVEAMDTLLPEHGHELRMGYVRLMEGGVLARAGMTERADAVMREVRAGITPAQDPHRELAQFEAAMRVLMGDHDGAIDLLQQYAAVNPHASFEHHWWWRDIRGRADLPRP